MTKTMSQVRCERIQLVAAAMYGDDTGDGSPAAFVDFLSDVMETAMAHYRNETHDGERVTGKFLDPVIKVMKIARCVAEMEGEGHYAVDYALVDLSRYIADISDHINELAAEA